MRVLKEQVSYEATACLGPESIEPSSLNRKRKDYKMRPSPHFFALVVLVTLFAAPLVVSAKSSDDRQPYAHRLELNDAFALDAPATGGIREEIADSYKERYQQWK